MNTLVTKQVYVTPPVAPAIPINFVKPLSYEFRVAEVIVDGKIENVKLQVQVWEHDEYGSGTVKNYWQDVPRIKVDKMGNIL